MALSVCPRGLEPSNPPSQGTSETHPPPRLMSHFSLLTLFTRCLPPPCHSELLGCSGTAAQLPPALSSAYEKSREKSKQWPRAPGRKSQGRPEDLTPRLRAMLLLLPTVPWAVLGLSGLLHPLPHLLQPGLQQSSCRQWWDIKVGP